MLAETPLVARMPELARLEQYLQRTLTGSGEVCFVAGEAGTGKTAVVNQFARVAQDKYEALVVAVGMCDPQTGAGDPYLPFREVLNLLLGNIDERRARETVTEENSRRIKQLLVVSTEILVDFGPDLIGLFVPGASLLSRIGQSFVKKADVVRRLQQRLESPSLREMVGGTGLDQTQIFEQCSNVLRALSQHSPLLIILDDLQWADSASLGLLFHLARRIQGSRILLLGTYRPEEIAAGRNGERHPLEKVLNEFKRYYGDIWVDLDQTTTARGREFIDTYLDTEPNRLGESFRQALYRHTGGQPLFTVELLRDMQDRGALVKDEDGYWHTTNLLNWRDLPARAEGVFEERIARLSDGIRRHLSIASVEGEQFTAEVLADLEKLAVRDLIRELSGPIHKEHQLVEPLGVNRVGQQRLSRYRFAHGLLHAYLYKQLDEIELSYLHEDVGRALESLYGELSGEIAVQLARHYERAEIPDKARHFLRLSGEHAATRFANAEATDYFNRALAYLDGNDSEERFSLLLARERVLGLQGARTAQQQDLAELERLAAGLQDPGRQALVAMRKAAFLLATGQYQAAIESAEQSTKWAVQAGDPLAEARALHRWGRAYWQTGDYQAARPHLDRALALARAHQVTGQGRLEEAQVLYDLGVIAYYQTDFEQARDQLDRASQLFELLGDRRGQIRCISLAANMLAQNGRYSEALADSQQGLQLSREVGWRYAESRIQATLGNVAMAIGDYATGRESHAAAIVICREIGDLESEATSLDSLGLLALETGRPDEARQHFEQALAIHESMKNLRGQGYAHTHLGYALTALGAVETAVNHLKTALALRQDGGSAALAMDTLAALAQAAYQASQLEEALTYVDQIRRWIDQNGVTGIEYPIQVLLICFQILDAIAAEDARPDLRQSADAILATGHRLLMEHAASIREETLEERFLQDVPYNQRLHQLWLARQDQPVS